MIPYVTKGVAILKRCVSLHKGKREMNAIGVMLFLNGPLLFISFVSSKEITDNCALKNLFIQEPCNGIRSYLTANEHKTLW